MTAFSLAAPISLTLFTSDTRQQYLNDALAVLATPPGSVFHFRYEGRYLPDGVPARFADGSAVGSRLLLAFRQGVGDMSRGQVLVPLRWAVLTAADCTYDVYNLAFVCSGYPAIVSSKDSRSIEAAEMLGLSLDYKASMTDGEWRLPVHFGFPEFVDAASDDDSRHQWLRTARLLAAYGPLGDMHLLRMDPPRDDKGHSLPVDPNGRFIIRQGWYSSIRFDYYAAKMRASAPTLNTVVQSAHLRLVSVGSYELESRYGTEELCVQGEEVTGPTRTEVVVSLVDGTGDPTRTVVRLGFVVRRSTRVLILRVVVTAVGAALVALPGVLQGAVPIWAKATSASLGALVLAYAVNFLRASKS